MALVTTTERKEFKPIGRRMDYTWDSLRDLLSRELGPPYAALLAEPLNSAGSGTTDWHTPMSGVPRKMSELDAEEFAALDARLYEMRLQVHKLADRIEAKSSRQQSLDKAFADALRRVVVVPDDAKFVYSMDGQPVLTEWSHVYIDDNRSESEIVGTGTVKRPRPGAAGSLPSEPAPTLAPPEVLAIEKPPRRFRWAWLWLLFAAIVGVIFYLLLQACGISTFAFDANFGRFTQACIATAPSNALDAEAQRRTELQQRIKQAELDLARLQGDCAPPVPPRVETPPPPPPQRVETQPPGGGPSIEDRLKREKAQTGELQITLAWNGLEDLDLHVDCPGGKISHNVRTACGGQLDVDMNYEKDSRDAVENIFFAKPPDGNYNVTVQHAGARNQKPRVVPFTVQIKRGSQTQTFNGSVSSSNSTNNVHSFTIP